MLLRNALLARKIIFTVGSGFALAVLLIFAITLLGLQQLERSNVRLETIVKDHNVKIHLATQMRDILRDRAISMLSLVVMNDAFEQDEEMLRFYAYGSAYQKVRLELETLIRNADEVATLNTLDRLTRNNQPIMVRVVNLAVEGYPIQAFEALQSEEIPMQRLLVKQLDALIQIQRNTAQKAVVEANANHIKTRNLILFLGLLAVLVAGLVAWLVVKRTARLAADTQREGTKFETLFETNTDGIVLMDANGFIDCNPATLEMFHMRSKAEFLACRPPELGKTPQECGTAAELLAKQHIESAMQSGHASFSWTARRPDDSTFPAQIDLHAMNLDGRTVIQAIMRDVSAQKETEDILRSARDAALSATEMKSQFVANVSHEIRTPMNGIIGMTQLLLASPLSSRQKEYVDAVSRSAESLMRVINDLLDFSKIEAGRLTLEVVDFDLGAQLRDILELYIPRADAKQLQLRLERRESISPLPTWVRGDPLRIRQVLLNLLDNAIKFTREGEVRLIVEQVFERAIPNVNEHANKNTNETANDSPIAPVETIRFTVQDTGLGMSAETQSKIFQAFSQGDSSVTRKFGGTGLGLTICRQLAELMGGTLTLDSREGEGSRFHLTLPLASALPHPTDISAQSEHLHFPGARVLVAEDNPVNQKLVGFMLENLGVEVKFADDGRAAFDFIKQALCDKQAVHLVFMDFQMPEWDGLTATRALRAYELQQNLPRLPVIALTANAMTGFEETCRQAGMDGFLSKPMREQDLAATLKQWLPRYQQSRDITADKTPSEPSAPLQAAHPAKRAFNREKIYKLCRNEPAQVIEMLELFISSTQPILVALRTAISNEDTAQASRQAHQIKGAAAYLGADLMTQHAADAERYGKLGEFDACSKSTDQLEAAFNTVCDDIRLDIQASSPFQAES